MQIYFNGYKQAEEKPMLVRGNEFLAFPIGVNVDTTMKNGIIEVDVIWQALASIEKHRGQTIIYLVLPFKRTMMISLRKRRPIFRVKILKEITDGRREES